MPRHRDVNQPAFDFGGKPRRPQLIFWWRETDERVIADWPAEGLRQTFQSWAVALDIVFHPRHPLQGDVQVRVRRCSS
jgi:hypothetical protein